jgi:hypothetical protein
MCTGEISSTLYDSYEDAVKDCETDMVPMPVYGIPRDEPEEEDGDDKPSQGPFVPDAISAVTGDLGHERKKDG